MTLMMYKLKAFIFCSFFSSFLFQEGVLTLSIDNDGAIRTDKDYSSGLFFRWSKVKNRQGFGIEFGSQIWTPQDIEAKTPQPNERPYAGLLYLKFNTFSQSFYKTTKLSLLLGKIGPSSKSGESQLIMHNIIGSPDPQGWAYQIHDENVYQFAIEQHVLMRRYQYNEWSTFSRVQAGNFQPEVAFGFTYRLGFDLPNTFAATSFEKGNLIDPSLFSTSSNGMFWYVSTEARFRFKDLTLDGDKSVENYPITPNHRQFAIASGVAWHQKDWGLTFSFVVQNQSFKQALYDNHCYANLMFFYRY